MNQKGTEAFERGVKEDGLVEEGEDTANESSDDEDSVLELEHMGMCSMTLCNSLIQNWLHSNFNAQLERKLLFFRYGCDRFVLTLDSVGATYRQLQRREKGESSAQLLESIEVELAGH